MEAAKEPEEKPENVDEDGILIRMPAENEAIEALAWIGQPTPGTRIVDGVEQPVTTYSALKVYDETISVGDPVYLHPEMVGMPCEIGLITRLFEDAEGEKMVTARWFWRSVHLSLPKHQKLEHPRELFLSPTSDDNPAAAIERRVCIYHLAEEDRVNKATFSAPDTFFYKRTYDPTDGHFAYGAPHEGNCLTGTTAAEAIAPPSPEPVAKKAKKTENRASTAAATRAEDDGEAQRALQQLAEKVERNRQDVLQRMEEVQGLAKAIKDEVARLGK